jgi:hypothetical protein
VSVKCEVHIVIFVVQEENQLESNLQTEVLTSFVVCELSILSCLDYLDKVFNHII